MKKSKRILALVLVLALAFTSFAMLASASEADIEERRAYSCPVCGTRMETTYEWRDDRYISVGSCGAISGTHTHTIQKQYRIEDCTSASCPYYSESYTGNTRTLCTP